jgi:hypothetical protein
MRQVDYGLLRFVISEKLSRALLRACSAPSIQEGLYYAHKEHLQWLVSAGTYPREILGQSLGEFFRDLSARIEHVDAGGRLEYAEAQCLLERLEEALDSAVSQLH